MDRGNFTLCDFFKKALDRTKKLLYVIRCTIMAYILNAFIHLCKGCCVSVLVICNSTYRASFPSEFCTYLLLSPSAVLVNCNLYMTVTKCEKCSQNVCHYIVLSIRIFPLRVPLFLLEVSLYFLAPGIFLRNVTF